MNDISLKYKLLALDLDGTLTNSKKKISQRNIDAIRKAQKRGVKVILASGRPVLGIKPSAEKLDLYNEGGYILAYNGGQIIDCKTGKDLVLKLIPKKYYHNICESGREFNISLLTYNNIGVLAENDTDPYVIKEAFNNTIPVIKVDSLEQAVSKLPDNNGEVVKFMAVGEPDKLNIFSEYLKEQFLGKLNVFNSEPYFLEITPLGIDKAASLENLCNILNVKREELMACGDGLNDIPMLKFAGLSVAMDNAYPETKAISDVIVSSNEEDGVAEAVEKFILSGE